MDTYTIGMAPQFSERLHQRARQLGEALLHDAQAAQQAHHEGGDFKDVAAQESIANIDEAQAAHAAAELASVESALHRIAEGTYGECLDCGDPIDLKRLAALPATAYCASCQGARERER